MENNDKIQNEIYDEIPQGNESSPQPLVIDQHYDRSEVAKTSIIQDLLLILTSTIGLYVVNAIIYFSALAIYKNMGFSSGAITRFMEGYVFLSYTNFIQYTVLFVISVLIVILGKSLPAILKDFKKFRTYLYGIGLGIIVIFVSVAYNSIIGLILPNLGTNDNQSAVEAVITIHPLLSLVWIPFLGPIVEEFTYRFGLFNVLRKINRVFAYVLTSIIFGLIHFNFMGENIWIELINLPPYIFSGLLFSYIYDRENVATSIVAHVTNNLVSYLATVFYMVYK